MALSDQSGTFSIQRFGNLLFAPMILDEAMEYAVDDLDFGFGAGNKNDAVSLEAFALPGQQFAFFIAVLINQHAAQAKACRTALTKPEFDKAALSRKDLDGQIAAIISSHDPANGFQEMGSNGAVVLKLLCTIVNNHSCARAQIFVMGAFVSILKSTPAADIIDEDCLELRTSCCDVVHQLLQCIPASNLEAASPGILIYPDYFKVPVIRIFADRSQLVFR